MYSGVGERRASPQKLWHISSLLKVNYFLPHQRWIFAINHSRRSSSHTVLRIKIDLLPLWWSKWTGMVKRALDMKNLLVESILVVGNALKGLSINITSQQLKVTQFWKLTAQWVVVMNSYKNRRVCVWRWLMKALSCSYCFSDFQCWACYEICWASMKWIMKQNRKLKWSSSSFWGMQVEIPALDIGDSYLLSWEPFLMLDFFSSVEVNNHVKKSMFKISRKGGLNWAAISACAL